MAIVTELCPKCFTACDNDNENVQTDNTVIYSYTCDECKCEFENTHSPGENVITHDPATVEAP